jgi:hypothetical protein
MNRSSCENPVEDESQQARLRGRCSLSVARAAAVAVLTGADRHAHVIPGWGAASTFDGEDAAAIVASVFAAPGDIVRADPWDGPLVTLRSVPDAVACLRVYGLAGMAAADAAATLNLPLTLTKRGCVVYTTKDPGR